jgi:alpha-beta hydrolase superfamily lysophospholipase
MNAFVLSFHPRRRSMVEYLCDRGFEVWTANLRGQGESRLLGRHPSPEARQFGIEALSQTDIPTALREVTRQTAANAGRVDVIGCSIGISYLYAYMATHSDDHPVGGVVAIGGPLQWRDVHPLMRALFGSPAVARLLPTKGMRQMAAMALPFVRYARPITDLYMNIDRIDFSEADELLKTVDDPSTQLNVDVAHWIQRRDMVVNGQNVTDGMGDVELPILCVVARSDFIVPESSVLSIQNAYSPERASELIDVLRIGADKETSDEWYAHADLFIGDEVEEDLFVPMADWLADH